MPMYTTIRWVYMVKGSCTHVQHNQVGVNGKSTIMPRGPVLMYTTTRWTYMVKGSCTHVHHNQVGVYGKGA